MKPINQAQISFDSRSVNESFGRAAVAAFLTQLDPTVADLTDMKTAVSEAVTTAKRWCGCGIRAAASRISKRPWSPFTPQAARNGRAWASR